MRSKSLSLLNEQRQYVPSWEQIQTAWSVGEPKASSSPNIELHGAKHITELETPIHQDILQDPDAVGRIGAAGRVLTTILLTETRRQYTGAQALAKLRLAQECIQAIYHNEHLQPLYNTATNQSGEVFPLIPEMQRDQALYNLLAALLTGEASFTSSALYLLNAISKSKVAEATSRSLAVFTYQLVDYRQGKGDLTQLQSAYESAVGDASTLHNWERIATLSARLAAALPWENPLQSRCRKNFQHAIEQSRVSGEPIARRLPAIWNREWFKLRAEKPLAWWWQKTGSKDLRPDMFKLPPLHESTETNR